MTASIPDAERALRAFSEALGATTSAWAVIGGLAVSARSVPRFTRDVDIAVAVSDDREAEGLTCDLGLRGWQMTNFVEEYGADRLAQVRLHSAHAGNVMCDLMFATSGIEREIVEQAETLEVLPGMTVPVAVVGHLIAMKLLSESDT